MFMLNITSKILKCSFFFLFITVSILRYEMTQAAGVYKTAQANKENEENKLMFRHVPKSFEIVYGVDTLVGWLA